MCIHIYMYIGGYGYSTDVGGSRKATPPPERAACLLLGRPVHPCLHLVKKNMHTPSYTFIYLHILKLMHIVEM